ncbi:hypothetical protein [Bacillus sp. USDA818B3_A]|uniref:hypothetical protein n=1 Tax=Bacillus sp. USDA818B3_A TaxID=2698834 RepID=UPI0013690F06|nr:hypothetical protein [Bacillus sp. USDA818B3_A]
MGSPILSPTFHIGTIKIGTIEGASCFSIGNNFIEDFKNSKQHSQGLGNIHGDRNDFAHMTASLTNHEKESQGNLEPQERQKQKTLD